MRTRSFGIATLLVSLLLICGVALVVLFPGLVAPSRTIARPVVIGAPFDLIDQNARPFSSARLAGKPYAIFFGYSHCRDECPLTLSDLSQSLVQLGANAANLNVVFVSFDPERDTPAVLTDYMKAFDPRIIALTGTPAAIAAAAKSYDVFLHKKAVTDGGYDFDHSSNTVLVDASGNYAGQLTPADGVTSQVTALRRLIAAS